MEQPNPVFFSPALAARLATFSPGALRALADNIREAARAAPEVRWTTQLASLEPAQLDALADALREAAAVHPGVTRVPAAAVPSLRTDGLKACFAALFAGSAA